MTFSDIAGTGGAARVRPMSFRYNHTLDPLVVALLALPPSLAMAGEISNQDFVTEAAQASLAEVRLGRLAAMRGSTAEVRSFGQQMIADHEPAYAQLRTLARALELRLPEELDEEHQRIEQKLQAVGGADFDRQYLATQLADHDRLNLLLQREAENGDDPGLRAFAAQLQPLAARHLALVKEMTYGGRTPQGPRPESRH